MEEQRECWPERGEPRVDVVGGTVRGGKYCFTLIHKTSLSEITSNLAYFTFSNLILQRLDSSPPAHFSSAAIMKPSYLM